MARRWTPQRFVMLRRIRVAVCAVAVVASMAVTFGVSTRKAVALNVNGKTTTVETYAMSVDRLLEEQGIDVRSHDLVESTSGERLTDHAVVTVRSAFQTTVNVDGEEIPFWTVADSADQLIGFFRANEKQASQITVDIGNIYNQLTGGLVINKEGPVTVIADGKTSVAPNGKLPAASILDSKGINVGKEDRVTVTQDGDTTILRVQRVTHGQETRVTTVPFSTRTIVDDSLQPGQTVVRQQGVNGEITQVYDVTYVDGVKESETLNSETTTKVALDQIIAVGPAKTEDDSSDAGDSGNSASGNSNSGTSGNSGSTSAGTSGSGSAGSSGSGSNGSSNKGDSGSNKNDSASSDKNDSGNSNSGSDSNSNSNSNSSKPNDSGSTDKPSADDSSNSGNSGNSNSNQNQNNNSQNNSGSNSGSNSNGNNNSNGNSNNSGSNSNNSGNSSSGGSSSGGSSASGRLWHPSIAQAKTYAAAAAAQRGWTGAEWDALVWIWEHESGWRWNADNPTSDAYGIPQALPGSKMGTGWKDDGAVQIDWGLSYISGRYGSPTEAKKFWLKNNWY
ncbi:G5 domain-containing protein [Bifidobacterium sp. MA2]|uniref:G5 domain-containing protein n=1 Tax=Bifidobacterium santillanense TaxID=2809028 RepID=A0ABS5UNX2_9BIFI|nr:G5 domain-containing protein [Bifidobacterium santillanense]MBT1172595.1 G5 domain-containing protein [Bifidobacterium santillanense]